MPKASQKDIAKLLDISQAAVSKALRGDPTISEKVRKRVKNLAAKLNYRPNRLARSLIDGKAPIVGLVMPQVFGAVLSTLLSEIERHLRTLGYLPLVVQTHTWDKDNRELIELLLEYKVQGIIVFLMYPEWEREFFEELIDNGEKIVFFNSSTISDACCVVSDENQGAINAINHFVEMGHRDIAFCWQEAPGTSGEIRLSGYRSGLRAHGLHEHVFNVSFESLEPFVDEVCEKNPEITAFLCADDHIAIKLESILTRRNISVPEKYSIIGFGNDFFYPDAMRTPLTTISHQPEKMAEKAISLLSEMINGKKHRGPKIIPSKLIRRDSVKALR